MSFASMSMAAYPERPIRSIVPFNPGGGTDLLTRTIQSYIDLDGQPLVPVYIPGASGQIGAMEVYRETPDGYTILGHNTDNLIGQYLSGGTDVKLWEEFEFICNMVLDNGVVITHPGTGWTSWEDVVEYAKANPGKIAWGTEGLRTPQAAAIMTLNDVYGFDFQIVPYDGGANARISLLGGHIELTSGSVSDMRELLRSGDAIPLLFYSNRKSPFVEGVLTPEEAGIPEFGLAPGAQRAYFAPPGTPKEVVDYLASKFEEVANNEDFIADMAAVNYGVDFIGPEEAKAQAMELAEKLQAAYEKYFE
ncbi:MAG: tripartite tricarboxylate transporter substrate binding protein [Atribacterota bacterium]|nr:tripartite tricarboxylate transporter substrate binding protein [Atribacterota bacterium]